MKSGTSRPLGAERAAHRYGNTKAVGSARSRIKGGNRNRSFTAADAKRRLVALPFADFARTVADLLARMGYEDVRLVGRAAGGGRNGTGGYDLRCSAADDAPHAPRRKVIVLLKQFGGNAWVFQRMVDELRGVAVREGAEKAILITTGRLSPVIAQCEGIDGTDPASGTLPPVQRIGGDRLCWLLAAYGAEIPHSLSPVDPVMPALPVGTAAPSIFKATASGGKTPAPSGPPAKRKYPLPRSSEEPIGKLSGIVLEVRVTVTR